MHKHLSKFVYILLFLTNFFCVRFIYANFLSNYSRLIFSSLYATIFEYNDTLLAISIIFILTYFSTTYLYQMYYYKALSKTYIYTFYITFFIFFVYVTLFKTMNVQGINLNPLTILSELQERYSIFILFNILLFIPIGFLKINVLKIIPLIICIEIFQFVFHTGIFDIIDIITNILGYIIGTYLIDFLIKKNLLKYLNKSYSKDRLHSAYFLNMLGEIPSLTIAKTISVYSIGYFYINIAK